MATIPAVFDRGVNLHAFGSGSLQKCKSSPLTDSTCLVLQSEPWTTGQRGPSCPLVRELRSFRGIFPPAGRGRPLIGFSFETQMQRIILRPLALRGNTAGMPGDESLTGKMAKGKTVETVAREECCSPHPYNIWDSPFGFKREKIKWFFAECGACGTHCHMLG